MIKGLKFVNKKAAAFGTYGWNDQASKHIDKSLREAGFDVVLEPLSNNWEPSDDMLEKCVEYGKKLVSLL